MRWFVLFLGLVCLGTPLTAQAKPKIAIASFKGDRGNRVASAIADALSGEARVVEPRATDRAIDKLGYRGTLSDKEARKVQRRLRADALVQGKLSRRGKRKSLHIEVFSGKKSSGFTVEFKTTSSKFKRSLREQIVKRVERDRDDRVADRDRDRDRKKKRKRDDDDDRKKRKKHKKRVADDDGDGDGDGDGDDDGGKVRKKRRRHHRGDETHLAGAMVAVGPAGGVRRLTYKAMTLPPRVGTFGAAVRIEGEVYPFALGDGKKGPGANLGFAGEFEKVFGLSITPPGTTTAIPIDQGHYSIGARYRIRANESVMLALGVDYAARHYTADRSAGAIDFPDIDYRAVVPSLCVMKSVTPKVGVFVRAGGALVLDTGPIQERDSYGAATVYGLGARVGADFTLTPRFLLRIAGDYDQFNFKFKGNGDAAMARGVTAATDRQFGVAAALAVTY